MQRNISNALFQILLPGICLLSFVQRAHAENPPLQVELIEVNRIWDHAPHNAFTDLIRFQKRWFCAFREGAHHVSKDGKLRILWSNDAKEWESAALLELEEFDLRDAGLSVMPDGRLMLSGGATSLDPQRPGTGSIASFSTDGIEWSQPEIVIPVGRWLWKVTWHQGLGYGVTYSTGDKNPASSLMTTSDGLEYETLVPELYEAGRPTEAKLQFDADTCLCLHRRDGKENSALLGKANPPYTKWQWFDLEKRLGGPNFMQLPDKNWVACGRMYDGRQRTELSWLDVERGRMLPLLTLPSSHHETSYPGMVWHDGKLWISYFSTHEKNTSIYLAQVKLSENTQS